ncbi:MAG: hypothetical protein ACUZ8E_08635 [Candidatus Anammoxibacter sp.]
MNILKRKKISFTIHILLIAIFSLASVKMCLSVLNHTFNNIDKSNYASAMDEDCCCDMTKTKSGDCCCAPPTLGSETVRLATNNPERKFLNAIISSLKCSNSPDYFYNNSLTDYEPIPFNSFTHRLYKNGSAIHLQESLSLEPHLLLQFKPPRNIS